MSEEAVRAFFDAYNRHDPDGLALLMTADGSFTSAYWGIDGRTYVGRDGMAEYFKEMGHMWERFEFELDRVEHGGDGRLVAVARFLATETGTEVSVATDQGLVFECRGERIASVLMVPDVDEALAQL